MHKQAVRDGEKYWPDEEDILRRSANVFNHVLSILGEI
jgi:hypothetical protein